MQEPTGVFRVDTAAKTLHPLGETDLAAHGLRERYDLQEWIEKHPQVLGEPLMIIAKECSSFDATNERADLVALDKLGNIVIIELKRDDSGTDVHWQAIKYASYFARATPEDILKLLCDHRRDLDAQSAQQAILQHIGQDSLALLNKQQRIILASHRFAREVTSAVLWLRDKHDVDITCVQLTPFTDTDSQRFYLQSKVIIPVPGTDDFLIGIGRPERVVETGSRFPGAQDDITRFMSSVVDGAFALLGEIAKPDRRSRWAGSWYLNPDQYRYYKIWYSHPPWENHAFSYQTHIISRSDGTKDYTVKFEVNLESAEQRGLAADDLNALRVHMKGLPQNKGFQFSEDKAMRVEYAIPMPDMDDSLRDKAAPLLAELIQYFTPIVEGIWAKDNQQDA